MLRLGCNIDKHEHDEDEESKGESDDKRSVDSLGCDPFSFLLDRFLLFDIGLVKHLLEKIIRVQWTTGMSSNLETHLALFRQLSFPEKVNNDVKHYVDAGADYEEEEP